MGKLSGTETSKNLARAFAGESQARNRYTIYAGYAKKEGHAVLEQEFKLIAENERAHAKVFYELLVNGMGASSNVNVDAGYPFELGDTVANLYSAAHGEHEEHTTIYPAFADVAKKEGFPEVEAAFRMIANIEKEHENKFKRLADELKSQTLYQKKEPQQWICSNCGHIHMGTEAPGICPVCKHPQGWFEVRTNQN